MCGIAAIAGREWMLSDLVRMVDAQTHRGPDSRGTFVSPRGVAGLGHNRLTIIDRTDAGAQPMGTPDGRYQIVFNGEIYNYRELRAELSTYPYRSRTDTEVVLAAYRRWGADCLRRFIGMFAFVIWDEREHRLFAARDRFGVKPLVYWVKRENTLVVGSEIKALRAAGLPAEFDAATWAGYFAHGVSDHSSRTFWRNACSLPAGHQMTWVNGALQVRRWYSLADEVGEAFDRRPSAIVQDEYMALLRDSVRLRFRSDVPVGINLSGGLDSSTLLGLVDSGDQEIRHAKAFTFVTGDRRYDELRWVKRMLASTEHRSIVCRLNPPDVPELAASVQAAADEPFGGIPTLAYARLFERARQEGVVVLLDGQGMDEQWAGYSYYADAPSAGAAPVVQGATSSSMKRDCLMPDFERAVESYRVPRPFHDRLRNLQWRDLQHTKIPRALRFNDRVSMRASVELREPFLDHRLVELALRQPAERKICRGVSKWLLREMVGRLLPVNLVAAPKRPVQTPQREWLRGPLREWADAQIETALREHPDWLNARAVRDTWADYCRNGSDNSFYVWQWISLGLLDSVAMNVCELV